MRVGVATIVAGRRDHLARQARAVRRLPGVSAYLVVAMDDAPVDVADAQVVRVTDGSGALPLAAARNRAIETLSDHDLVVLLDVDCIPARTLVSRYVAAARSLSSQPSLLAGPVGYLAGDATAGTGGEGDPTPAARARARRRVIRDFPARGVERQERPELFWSLSFAVSPAVHRSIGGFDEAYVGYGAEDTDYGLRAHRAGVGLWFVGGAWSYHQPHPPSGPVHVGQLSANATRFHDRWGWWPMPDVLAGLARTGTIRWDPDGAVCEAV